MASSWKNKYMLCLNLFLQTNKLDHIIKNTKIKQLKLYDFSGIVHRVGQIESKKNSAKLTFKLKALFLRRSICYFSN